MPSPHAKSPRLDRSLAFCLRLPSLPARRSADRTARKLQPRQSVTRKTISDPRKKGRPRPHGDLRSPRPSSRRIWATSRALSFGAAASFAGRFSTPGRARVTTRDRTGNYPTTLTPPIAMEVCAVAIPAVGLQSPRESQLCNQLTVTLAL
jgi:hypothetical protein